MNNIALKSGAGGAGVHLSSGSLAILLLLMGNAQAVTDSLPPLGINGASGPMVIISGQQGIAGTSFSGTKATAFVGTDDNFNLVTTAKP